MQYYMRIQLLEKKARFQDCGWLMKWKMDYDSTQIWGEIEVPSFFAKMERATERCPFGSTMVGTTVTIGNSIFI